MKITSRNSPLLSRKKSPKDEVFAILEKVPNQNSPETIAYFLEKFYDEFESEYKSAAKRDLNSVKNLCHNVSLKDVCENLMYLIYEREVKDILKTALISPSAIFIRREDKK
jgi:hypothetical protein